MKVYFISGLGSDSRVFKHIRLPDGFEAVHLDWIPPAKNESLESYSLRLAESIDQDEPFGLLGLSMGGMIALEISKKYTPAATILISSVPSSSQFPPHFRIAHLLRLHKIIPIKLLKSATVVKRFFTAETPSDKKILRAIIRDSEPRFIRWGIEAILQWKNDTIPGNVCHIHGEKDEILPVKHTSPTFTIPKGTHMMVMTQADELNHLLYKTLKEIR